jgi:Carboxypeptidase regulatory-like domain
MLPAQVHKVDPEKTITFEVAGATAAYSVDSTLAEASANNGIVSVIGIYPGTTHVIVITPSGVQTFEFLVTTPPPIYPRGFVMPAAFADSGQSGSYEGRYYSSPAQIQSQFDFMKVSGDNWTHFHLVETNLLGPLGLGLSRAALSSATYEVFTPRRDITVLDKFVDESQLTINGSIVRGFHMTDGNWFVHGGYTSVATFDGLFLPLQPELVVGGGYRYPVTENTSITGSFYRIDIRASDLLGRSGNVGDLRYKYKPRDTFWMTADLGIGNGIAAAGKLHFVSAQDTILGLIRYMPEQFASLGANNLRGLHTDFSWARHVTKKLEADLSFYNNNLVLPGLRENTISGAINLRYQLTRHWDLTGGANASSFQTKVPLGPAIRNLTLPAGLDFQSRHFGASGQYQYSVTPGNDSGAKQFRATLQSGWGDFKFNAFAERDTNAPTLNFIFGLETGLEQLLDQQGIRATTIQQVDQLLSSDAYLIAAGYLKGATINLVPVRTQVGGTADWSTHGVHKRDLNYNFLYNDNELLQGSSINITQTLAYTQSVTRADNISLSCSVVALKTPGTPQQFTPLCFAAWRHQFHSVPYFIIPERHGTISGNIFRDDQSVGSLEPGMKPIAEVEVMLDDRRRALTRSDGTYRFANVPRGKHKIAALYHSRDAFFFTTPSDAEVDEDATVDFGIGYTLSGLMGQVLNDAGQGIGGINVKIQSRGRKWSAVSEADGSFFVPSLVAGEYEVQADADSLPPGYSASALVDPRQVTVGATSPGNAAFSARAFRSISGRVLRYDPQAVQYVPVIGTQVALKDRGVIATTDPKGRYLFRDLAAGSYTLSVSDQIHTVRLGDQPVDLTNIDFSLNAPQVALAVPEVAPVKPRAAIVTPPVNLPPHVTVVLENVGAEQHNILGRQLTKVGRYREAVVELTEAIRIAPDFALAFNARGFALILLHDWVGAIADLNKAILLNPAYGNAYQLRSIARRGIGDGPGATADLKKSRELAH